MAHPILEKEFNYKGFNCYVLFMPLGHRCGYVEIPNNHKFFGKDYDEIPINVHGGLTYGEPYLNQVSPQEAGRYFIGWDYAHYGDSPDEQSYFIYYGDPIPYPLIHMGIIYSTNDVESDCKSVVDQLIKE